MRVKSVTDLLNIKKEAKEKLAKELSFSRKIPVLGIILDKELSKETEENVCKFLDGVSSTDVKVILLADSNVEALSLPEVIVMPYSRDNRQKLLVAADLALAFSFSDVEEMLMNGIIPISGLRPEISDYDPTHETGNSFVYKNETPWDIFAALVRARETFKFPYDWKHIVRQGIDSICSES